MTIEELLAREAIREVMAKYAVTGNRLDVADFLCCFTEDAIIESEFAVPEKSFRFEGTAAIRAWQQRWLAADEVYGTTFVRHHLTTSTITMTGPGTAMVRTYWTVWTDIGPDHAGIYLDDFRKVGDNWLIAHRRIRYDWAVPDSVFGIAIAKTKG